MTQKVALAHARHGTNVHVQVAAADGCGRDFEDGILLHDAKFLIRFTTPCGCGEETGFTHTAAPQGISSRCRCNWWQLTASVSVGTLRSFTVMLFLPVNSAPSIFRLLSCFGTSVTDGPVGLSETCSKSSSSSSCSIVRKVSDPFSRASRAAHLRGALGTQCLRTQHHFGTYQHARDQGELLRSFGLCLHKRRILTAQFLVYQQL